MQNRILDRLQMVLIQIVNSPRLISFFVLFCFSSRKPFHAYYFLNFDKFDSFKVSFIEFKNDFLSMFNRI